jgi:hypothetical protein
MNRKQWLVVIGVTSLAVGGCSGGKVKPGPNPNVAGNDSIGIRRHTVEGFLSDTGRMKAYDSALVVSLCQLEGKTKGLDSVKRICPTGNPNDVDIPTYPPKPPQPAQ